MFLVKKARYIIIIDHMPCKMRLNSDYNFFHLLIYFTNY